jgi:hypothetical protein
LQEGQGLGRDEQGMSSALSVEKTSKRGGRIVHEKDLAVPPPPLFSATPSESPAPDQTAADSEIATTPPYEGLGAAGGEPEAAGAQPQAEKPSITDLMRNPSKVVLCKNMVGPGEVDDELEPEVKEECASKYGEVAKVIIFELQNVAAEEAVRIFIEFKRVESAIKGTTEGIKKVKRPYLLMKLHSNSLRHVNIRYLYDSVFCFSRCGLERTIFRRSRSLRQILRPRPISKFTTDGLEEVFNKERFAQSCLKSFFSATLFVMFLSPIVEYLFILKEITRG